MEPPPIVLVVALSQEQRALRRVLDCSRRIGATKFPLFRGELGRRPVLLLQAGVGRTRVCRALLETARLFSYRAAWSLGFAGGLVEDLRPGTLVVPSSVFDTDRLAPRPLPAGSDPEGVRTALASAGIVVCGGMLLSVNAPLQTPESKRAAHHRLGAVAVDMEAAGVAETAERLGIPWLAIKAIVDPVGEALPEHLLHCTTCEGDLAWRGVLWNLTSGRRRAALFRLGRASRRAALALGHGLRAAMAGGYLDAGLSPPVGWEK